MFKPIVHALLAVIFSLSLFTLNCTSPTETPETPVTPEVLPTYTVTNDASYYLWAFGDDSLDLYINGTLIGHERPTLVPLAQVPTGKYTVAAMVYNTLFGGGFLACIVKKTETITFVDSFTGYDTVISYTQVGNLQSDSTWKYSYHHPEGWQNSSFNDADWLKVGDYGEVGTTIQGWQKIDSGATAHWIYMSRTNYFRKKFTSAAGGSGILRVSANNHVTPQAVVDVYLNGTLLIDKTKFGPTGFLACTTEIAAGSNILAVQLMDTTRGNGAAFALDVKAGTDTVVSDSTWKCSDKGDAGWNTAAFDDASWANAGVEGDIVKSERLKFTWPAFENWWSDRFLIDTTVEDTTFTAEPETLFFDSVTMMYFVDTIKTPVSVAQRDTSMMVKRLTKAHWIYPPADVYLRYKFNITLQ